jgi:NhaP-type Na+/H+ or K+/H+ antiporter
MLFALIGAAVDLDTVTPDHIALGFLVLGCGLSLRLVAAFFAAANPHFARADQLFTAIAFMPKATVQAAIASIPLDTVRANDAGDGAQEARALFVLTISVLAILVTAPLGAVGIALAGPRLLRKAPQGQPPSVARSATTPALESLAEATVA